ncbi:hypothetical protein ACYJ2U_001779 [Clostridium botulinum]
MKMYVDLFKSKGDKTTCTVSYNGRMVMYHGKSISYYADKILKEAKDCDEIFVDTRGLSRCLYDSLKKADRQNRVKELDIQREEEKDTIDKILEMLNFDKNKMPNFQEVIRELAIRWKKFNDYEKDMCTKVLSEEFKSEILNTIEKGRNFDSKSMKIELTPNKVKDGVCANISIKENAELNSFI